MKPELQRVAIAEAVTINFEHRAHFLRLLSQETTALWAMHEAEKVLTREQVTVYVTELRGFVSPENWEGCWGIHATAAQRAEAFLRTLNLWKDET